MTKKKLARIFSIALSGVCVSLFTCCASTGGNSVSEGGSDTGSSDSEITVPADTVKIGTEGWYSLAVKTVDGKDISATFVKNAIRLEDGKAYTYEADFEGLKEQEGTYAVEGDTVSVTFGIKTYKYVFDEETAIMTYTGKINKQQVVMSYRYDETFSVEDTAAGVSFTDELFGEDLNENFYNYCPSIMIENNDTMHIWYCSNEISGNVTDYVAYRKGVLNDGGKWVFGEKQLVLAPTADTWDSRHTCDPSVIKGTFEMGGENYGYLMAYLGCKTSNNCCNEVGIAVAKAPEGPWVKVDSLNPIANFYTSEDYNASSWGYGQPCVLSVDKAGKVFLIYTKGVTSGTYAYLEEWDFSDLDNARKLRETRLSDSGVVNASGQTDVINNADFAYDPHLQRLYCLKEDFPYPTDGVNWITGSNTLLYIDLGDSGMDTVFETHRWNVAGKVTKEATGFFRCHNMGIMTDPYGQLTNPYKIPIVYTMSDNAEDYPDWNKGGQWPALHTYRLHGYILETK